MRKLILALLCASSLHATATYIGSYGNYNGAGGSSIASNSATVAQHDSLFVGVLMAQNGCGSATRALSDPALNTYTPVHTLINNFSGACLATYKLEDAASFTGSITVNYSPAVGSGIGIIVLHARGVTGGVETSATANPGSRQNPITTGTFTTTSTDSIILGITGWYLFDSPTIAVGTGGQCASSGCTLTNTYTKGAGEYKVLSGTVTGTTIDFGYGVNTSASISMVVMKAPAAPPYRPPFSIIFGDDD